MTLFEAQAAAPILASVFGDAEVRRSGAANYDYFVRAYDLEMITDNGTIDVDSADAAGRLIAERINGA